VLEKRDLELIRLAVRRRQLTAEEGEDCLFLKRKFGPKYPIEEIIRKRGYLEDADIEELAREADELASRRGMRTGIFKRADLMAGSGSSPRQRPVLTAKGDSGLSDPGPEVENTTIDGRALRSRSTIPSPPDPSVMPPDEIELEEKTMIGMAPHVLARRSRSAIRDPSMPPPPPRGFGVDDEITQDKLQSSHPVPSAATAPVVRPREGSRSRPAIQAPAPPKLAPSDTLLDPRERRPGTFTGLAPGAFDIQDRTLLRPPDPADVQMVVPVPESEPPRGEPGADSLPPDPGHDDVPLGPRFGPYEILRVIARGGRATVYLAVRSGSSEPLAIKVLKRSVARSPEHRTRILKEAQAAIGIDSPNVLKLLDVGVVRDQIYLAMRYVDGWTLAERLESGDVPDLAESLRIVREVARGLGAASLQSVAHRDVKPDNIMIARDGSVLLTDFGLATARGGSRSTGLVAGSPAYVSPEQALGQPVDVRSDLYSLGATLFELVTGRTMYMGRTEVSVITKHIHEPPPKLATIRPSLPTPVITLVTRLLEKSPANRFQSALELVSALDVILGEVGQSAPQTQDMHLGVLARAAIGSASMVLLSISLPMLIEWFGHISWEHTRALLDTAFLGAGGAVVALVLLAALGLVRRGELPLPGSSAWLVAVKEATGAIGAAFLVAGAVLGPPAVMNMTVSVIAVLVLSSWVYGILLRRRIAELRPDRGIGHVLAVLGDPRLERWRLVHAPLLTTLAFLATVRFALLAYFQAAKLG
jgi:hypothetical protein